MSGADLDRYDGLSDAELAAEHEIEDEWDTTTFVPPGPVGREFLNDPMISSFIMGPVGGGKTVVCAMKRILAATMMPPTRDGWRKCRWAVVRDTYRAAQKSVLQSWQQWFHKDYPGSTWTGGDDRPAVHTLRFQMEDGTKLEAVTEFIGLNGNRIESVLRGQEFSGGWLNEVDTLDAAAISYMENQRIGRYPAKRELAEGAQRHKQLIGDFNAPDRDNYLFALLEENPNPLRRLHKQPAGLVRVAPGKYIPNPMAENMAALDADYYLNIAAREEDWYIRRFVMNEFGYSRAGLPVHNDYFDDAIHVARDVIAPNPRMPLIIGLDGSTAGLRPAAVFMQPTGEGSLDVVEEVVPGQGYGASRFAELVLAQLQSNFRRVPDILAWSDPASQYGGDKEGGQLAWLDIVSNIIGVPIQVPFGGSNEISLRLEAVRAELRPGGKRPPMRISPNCVMIVRGFASGYRYKKLPPTARTKFDVLPEKNEYSDPLDALGYGIGGYRGHRGVIKAATSNAYAGDRDRKGWLGQGQDKSPWRRPRAAFDPTQI